MSAVFNSSNSFIAELTRINKNAIEILNTLALTASTSSESIDVQLTLENSQVSSLTIPSLGYINNELKRLNNNINQLAGIGQTDVLVRQQDGSYQKVIAVNLNPAPRRINSLTVPTNFVPRDNYFFNNLVSPQMVVRFDLTGKIDSSVKKVMVRRLILNIDSVDKQTIFNNNFRNRPDLAFDETVIFLTDGIINFSIDDETIDLPLSTPRYFGNFTVTQVLEQVSGQSNTRRYTFSSLSYTDSISRIRSNQTLKPGDVLVKGASTFAVQEVDSTTNVVTLKRLQGEDVIAIGVDELSIQSELYNSQIISVPITVDEYQIIFMKPIFDNIMSSEWSPGVAFYSNELFYQTAAGNQTITDFYNTRVVDLSEELLAQAREKRVSILTGTKPSPPQILPQNFTVQRLNDQLEGVKSEQEINQIYNQIQINDRTISSLGSEINKINSILTSNANLSTSQVQSYQSSKKSLQSQIDSLNEQNAGLLTRAQNFINQNPNLSTTNAKYSVFGFWEIPTATTSTSGRKEEIVAFRVKYRYLPVNDSVASARQIPFTTTSGADTSAYFSRYEEFVTKPRTKTVLPDGRVVWTGSDIQDPNQVNTQQLNLAITQGERLEIQVASISEAGWPSNPLESDFSSSIIVDFPDSLVSPDLANLVNSIQTRLAQQGLQDTITNLGINQHLQQVQQVGSSYIAHSGDSIYYSLTGSSLVTINQKIRELEEKITALQTKIESARGTLRVRIKDPFGNITTVSNGATIKVNSGFYTEDLKAVPSTERAGAIITKRYDVIIDNTSATPLQLISQFPGLLTDLLPRTPVSILSTFKGIQVPSDYAQKQYDIAPIGLAIAPQRGKANFYDVENVAMQPVPFQSRQQAGQFIYVRNVAANGGTRYFTNAQLLKPTSSGTANTKVWNGTFDTTNTVTINGIQYLKPLGGGALSNFCVSIDHPAVKFIRVVDGANQPNLQTASSLTIDQYFNSQNLNNTNPSLASNAPFRYPQFYHASTFTSSPINNLPSPQASYSDFSTIVGSNWPYPMKQSFYQNDRYLIGSNTVGSYLFVEAPSMEAIKVKGTGLDSSVELDFGSENQITIPVVFQYRMVDYLGNVGGALNGVIANLTYVRGLGMDISIKGEPTFSFDFIVNASYTAQTVTEYTTTTVTSTQS